MSGDKLLVDIGNSRLKWALLSVGGLWPGPSFPSDAMELETRFEHHWADLAIPGAVLISNVAGPAIQDIVDRWLDRRWDLKARCARAARAQCGVVNGYADPGRLGVDRWLALLALARHHPLPACVVDCGTAITLDCLDSKGRHHGGLIAPGLETMRRSLVVRTHQLGPASDPGMVVPLLARDTTTAIQSGCLLACAGLIEKALTGLTRRIDRDLRLVMTGGDAARIGGYLDLPHELDDLMVLRGLQCAFE